MHGTANRSGAVAPPPPGKSEAEVTTAAGALLARSGDVQAAECERMNKEAAKSEAARQKLIERLPTDADWLPGPGEAAAAAAAVGTEHPEGGRTEAPPPRPVAEAPATPQGAAPQPAPRGPSLDFGAPLPAAAAAETYKEPPELLAAPPGGQISIAGRRLFTGEVPAPEPIVIAAAAAGPPCHQPCADALEQRQEVAHTAAEVYAAHNAAAAAAAGAAALVHLGVPVPAAANIAEAALDPAASFDFDAATSPETRAPDAADASEGAEERAAVLQRLRSVDAVMGPAAAGMAREPAAPETPVRSTTPGLLHAHDRATHAAAVAGALVHMGQPVARSAGLAEAVTDPVAAFDAAPPVLPATPARTQGTAFAAPAPGTTAVAEERPKAPPVAPEPPAADRPVEPAAPRAAGSFGGMFAALGRMLHRGVAPAPAPQSFALPAAPAPPSAVAAAAAASRITPAASAALSPSSMPPASVSEDQEEEPAVGAGPLGTAAAAAAAPPTPASPPPPLPVATPAAPAATLAANARLMSQLSHGRAGQAPKALGVGSDSRLSVAGSSMPPSRVPSEIAATSDSEIPAPPPPGLLFAPPAGAVNAVPSPGGSPAPQLRAALRAQHEAAHPGAANPQPHHEEQQGQEQQGEMQQEEQPLDCGGPSVDRMAAMVCSAVEMGLATEADVAAEQPPAVVGTAHAALVSAGGGGPLISPSPPLLEGAARGPAAGAHPAAPVPTVFEDVAIGVWPSPAAEEPRGSGRAAAPLQGDQSLEGEEEEGPPGGEDAGGPFGGMPLAEGAPEVGICDIAGAQELLAADTSRAPGGAIARGMQPRMHPDAGSGSAGGSAAEGGEGEYEETGAEGEGDAEEECGLGVTMADVVGLGSAPAGSARFYRARAKTTAAAAGAAGLRAAGRPLREAVELAEVATAPADIVDASASHVCGACSDAAWDRLAATGGPTLAPIATASGAEEDAGSEPGEGPSTPRMLGVDAPPGFDLARVPTSPINRVDSTVPMVAEMSAEQSLSSAGSGVDFEAAAAAVAAAAGGGAGAAEAAAAAATAARGRAGCALPRPEVAPGAVEAHNRAARVAAAACGLRYAGVSVKEAAAVAEVVFSAAASIESAAAAAAAPPCGACSACAAAVAAAAATPSAPRLAEAAAARAAAAPVARRRAAEGGEEEEEGSGLEAGPLLGPASPKCAAGASLMGTRWDSGEVRKIEAAAALAAAAAVGGSAAAAPTGSEV